MPILRSLRFLFVAFNLLILSASATQDTNNDIVIIVNKQVRQSSISKSGLRGIFRMRLRTWQDNTPITVFVLPDTNPVHSRFCKEILNVFPNQMRRAWNRLMFSGTGQAPITVDSKREMLQRVKSTSGAIGYLPRQDVTEEVKILQIE